MEEQKTQKNNTTTIKIRINDKESHLFENFPIEMGREEITFYQERFSNILKMMGRDPLISTPLTKVDEPTNLGRKRGKYKKKDTFTREQAIEAMKIYYSPISREERIEHFAEKGLNLPQVTTKIGYWKTERGFSIKPEEVGLIRWPVLGMEKAHWVEAMKRLKLQVEGGQQ